MQQLHRHRHRLSFKWVALRFKCLRLTIKEDISQNVWETPVPELLEYTTSLGCCWVVGTEGLRSWLQRGEWTWCGGLRQPRVPELSPGYSGGCQHCQRWSVRKDFSWQNSEATLWHLQQTNCCLLPPRVLWSPNDLVSSQEMRKGTHKINLSGYYALSSAKTKTC